MWSLVIIPLAVQLHIREHVLQWMERYGYFALFALVALESLGIPLPGETILIAAGTYAGTTHKLSVWVIFLVAAGAARRIYACGQAREARAGRRSCPN